MPLPGAHVVVAPHKRVGASISLDYIEHRVESGALGENSTCLRSMSVNFQTASLPGASAQSGERDQLARLNLV